MRARQDRAYDLAFYQWTKHQLGEIFAKFKKKEEERCQGKDLLIATQTSINTFFILENRLESYKIKPSPYISDFLSPKMTLPSICKRLKPNVFFVLKVK